MVGDEIVDLTFWVFLFIVLTKMSGDITSESYISVSSTSFD